jgi:hypothetical protein
MSQSGSFFKQTIIPPGTYVETLTGDLGGPIAPDGAGNINVIAGVSTLNSGSSVDITGIGHTLTLNVTDALGNTIIGLDSGNPSLAGNNSTGLGFDVLPNLLTGNGNLALGYQSGSNYTGSESNNILLSNAGVLGESGVTRIGTAQTAFYAVGIDDVALTTANVVTESGNQLGTAVITAGTNITIDAASMPNQIIINSTGGGGDVTITTDDANVQTGPAFNLLADSPLLHNGSTVNFTGDGATNMYFNTTDSSANIIIGLNAGNTSLLGDGASYNTSVGAGNMQPLTTGSENCAFGYGALNNANTSIDCVAVGFESMITDTASLATIAVGPQALYQINGADYTIGIGYQAGANYTSTESNNIVINALSTTVTGEQNTCRIGDGTGTGQQQLQATYISGIDGVALTTANVVTEAGNQLGTAVITAGSGISVTPGANTITIAATGGGAGTITGNDGTPEAQVAGNWNILTANSNIGFVGSAGTETLDFIGDANANIILGSLSYPSTLTGSDNTGLGFESLITLNSSSGSGNTGIGSYSFSNISTESGNTGVGGWSGQLFYLGGSYNTCIGYYSGGEISGFGTGSYNTFLGTNTANNYNSAESNNILINSLGVVGESNVLRICDSANTSTGTPLSATYIGGIDGVALTTANVVTEVGDHLGTAVLTAGAGISIDAASTPNQIIITNTGGGGGITTINGDTGNTGASTTPTIYADNAALNCGSTVLFVGDNASTLTLNVTDALGNVIIGLDSGNATITGTDNTIIGPHSGGALTSGVNNTQIGGYGMPSLTSGSFNFGAGAAFYSLTTGSNNFGLGQNTLFGLVSGDFNTCVGVNSGYSYTSNESSNIIFGGNQGFAGDQNTLRIGNGTGSSPTQLSRAFISGIDGVALTTANVVTESGDQLGTAVLTAGTGISITPGANTITIDNTSPASGITIAFDNAQYTQQTPFPNCIIDFGDTGGARGYNVGFGSSPNFNINVNGRLNTFLGYNAMNAAGNGDGNVAIGADALSNLATTGYANVAIGIGAGQSYTTTEYYNICINNPGVIGDQTTTRIGALNSQTACYISGITGVNVSGAAVFVTGGDQLGIVVSSRKYKDNIEDMGSKSEDIYKLRPTTFTYKESTDTRYGLIAEEVAEVFPNLVVYDQSGDPQTVMYHELPSLLLNEIQKLRKEIDELKKERICQTP